MHMQREFSHSRFIFLLIIVLNTLETKDYTTKPQIIQRKHFDSDLKYCQQCFEAQFQHCSNFFKQIDSDKDFSISQFLGFLPKISCKRNNQLIKLRNSNVKLIAKYLFNQEKTPKNNSDLYHLRRAFLQQHMNMQGMQYAPLKAIDHFIRDLQKLQAQLSEITIWNYLLNNIQLLIFPILYELNFPVPQTYEVCGFTLYQQYAGDDLYNFFKTDFLTQLKISKQLLKAAIKFSHGFSHYRLYITDLTADNIVYDKANNQIFFIDLDTIFIVAAREAKYKSSTHKHLHMECPGCFAYSPDDIAAYNISDVNIFLSCQFLREDLYKNYSKGFLYSISLNFTSTNSKLWQLINKCVDCPDNMCSERFTVAKEIIELIDEILQH